MSSFQPSPEQKAVLDMGLDTIRIRAGAGTGKTTTVALVIANLVENHGVDPEQILGITFTNKVNLPIAGDDRAIRPPVGPAPVGQCPERRAVRSTHRRRDGG